MKRNRALSVFILSSLLGIQLIFAQQTININNEGAQSRSAQTVLQTHQLRESVQTRSFDFNPKLKSLTKENVGDILLLDLFSDKQYRALVKKVTHSYNGITGITAKIENSDFGYCYVSVSEEGVLINMELPEKDEYYLATSKTGNGFLSEYRISDLKKDKLECTSLTPPSPDLLPIGLPETGEASVQMPVQTPDKQHSRAAEEEDELAVINVLIVYTMAAKEYFENTQQILVDLAIDAAMQKANEASVNSHLNIDFNLVYSYLSDYQELNSNTDLDNLTNPDDGKLDEVHALRRKYNADLVMLVPKVEFTGGLGWLSKNINGAPGYGFALSRAQQFSWTYTMVHELAHNMGCGHHNDQLHQPGPGIYPYSGGWKGTINGQNKCTIMTYGDKSYWSDGSSYDDIPYFSSPDILYPETNVTIGDAQTADNARTLRQTKHVIGSYRETIGHTVLTDIQVNGAGISGFDPDQTIYTLTVDSETVTIKGVTTNEATARGNITDAVLNYGENIFRLSAASNSGNYTKNYTLIINRTTPACGSYLSSPSFKGDISASAGDDALNLEMEPGAPIVEANPFTVNMTGNPTPIYIRESKESIKPYSFSDGADFEMYLGTAKIKVTEDGDYTFTANFNTVLTLFDSATPSYSSFINSSGYWIGGTRYSYSMVVTATLKANTTYYLRAVDQSAPTSLLTISTKGPGTCYFELEVPSRMSYTYIAVDQSDNKIKMQSATADFRAIQPGIYTVYGAPYSYGSDPTTFIGKTTNEIQDSDCVIPSRTSIALTVTGKSQEQLDKETVEAAKTTIEAGTYHIEQGEGGNTEADIKAWIGSTISNMLSSSQNAPSRSTGITLEEVTITNFTPATAGTEAVPEGIEGSFTFTATLKLGATTLTTAPVSGVITATQFTVGIGIDGAQQATFKAWVHNELLYVSGLTVGKAWSVYSTSDALIYQGMAKNNEECVKLPVRGIYVVVSGSRSIKVRY